MNERIRELAERLDPIATIGNWGRVEWADNVYPQLGDKMYAAVDLQKFAELIVRECLSVIEEMNPHDPERDIDDIFVEVEKHFGVES